MVLVEGLVEVDVLLPVAVLALAAARSAPLVASQHSSATLRYSLSRYDPPAPGRTAVVELSWTSLGNPLMDGLDWILTEDSSRSDGESQVLRTDQIF